PSQGFFSPFPHGTGSLSVTREHLALRDGPRSFSRDFTCPAILRVPVGANNLSSTGLSPSLADRSRSFDYAVGLSLRVTGPTTPSCRPDGLGYSAFARRYWRNHYCFLFLQVLRWFTSLRCLPRAYGFSAGYSGINQSGFPHSEIPGSKLVCSSPGLIAAYRVLHRLLVPRHSPYTLSSLTIRNSDLHWILSSDYSVLRSLRESMHTACVWSVKLPFAEYSVVKDPDVLDCLARVIVHLRASRYGGQPSLACQP